MDVKCPVCDERVSGEGAEDLTSTLRRHLEEVHAFSEMETNEERQVRTFSRTEPEELPPSARTKVEEVAQFKEPRPGETPEERAVSTFSGREPYGGSEETKEEVEKVTQFREPRLGETKKECETRTFSETECSENPVQYEMVKEEVGQWKYPRTGPGGERGPGFQCPVCGVPITASDEEGLSVVLKEHFTEVHQVETERITMKK